MLKRFAIVSLIMLSVSILSASAEVWEDSFDGDGISERWTTAVSRSGGVLPTDWQVEGGVLKGHWTTWGQQHLIIEYPPQEYTIQVRCRFDNIIQSNNGNEAGIVFHSLGPNGPVHGWGSVDFYGFAIGPTPGPGYAAFFRFGAGWYDAPVSSVAEEPISVGEWYTLRLVVEGNRFRGYVNEELVIDAQDDGFRGDYVGLYMGLYVDASFDDFMIMDQAGVVSAVSAEGKLSTAWGHMKTER